MAGRTHNVPAQLTTFGKKLANFGEEILIYLNELDSFIENYPVRGIKGPVGTQQDMQDLLGINSEQMQDFELKITENLGFKEVANSIGQVYPRSLDAATINRLTEVTSGIVNLTNQIRLMAGQNLATEGFTKNQVGSSAMPHKMNARTCERIWSLHTVLKGYQTTANNLSGSQWNEGDVSCSAVRRIILPNAFYAADGIVNSMLIILDEFGVYEKIIAKEVSQYLPFLASTKLLVAAVSEGMGRETAHSIIKKHSVCIVKEMQNGKLEDNDLLRRLDEDQEFNIDIEPLTSILEKPIGLTGSAVQQVERFVNKAKDLRLNFSKKEDHKVKGIL